MATGAVQKVLTGVAYDVAVGIVAGGSWGEDGNTTVREGIGGVGVIVPGLNVYKTSFDVLPVDASCLADKVLRASYPVGALTAVPLDVGDDELNIQEAAWLCNSMEASMDAEGALQISYEFWTRVKPTKSTGSAETYAPVKTTAEWYNAAATLAGSPADFKSLSFSVQNNLIVRPSLDTAAADSRRYPEGLEPGPEVVTATAVYNADPDHDLELDALPTATVVLTASTSNDTPVVITFTGTTMKVLNWSSQFVQSGTLKEFSVEYGLDHNSGGFAITVV